MYGLSPEQAKPGCTARELLELRAANGTFAGDIDAYLTSQIIQGGKVDAVFEIPDGRSIRVVNRFMDDGGWVSDSRRGHATAQSRGRAGKSPG